MQKLSLWLLSAEIKDQEVEVGSLKQLKNTRTYSWFNVLEVAKRC